MPYDSHATQAFAHLKQGPDELLEMYLHHANKLFYQKYITQMTCLKSCRRFKPLHCSIWSKLCKAGQSSGTPNFPLKQYKVLLW